MEKGETKELPDDKEALTSIASSQQQTVCWLLGSSARIYAIKEDDDAILSSYFSGNSMVIKILRGLQERIKHWIKPATSILIIGILSDLTRSRADLVVENALLRQQLIVLNRQVKRPLLTNPERFRLVFLSHITTFWKQALPIVQPDTLLRWHRELFQFYWRRKSHGQPKIPAETIGRMEKLAKENQ